MRVFNDHLDPIDPAAFGMGAALQAAVGGGAPGGHGAGGGAHASPRGAATVFRGNAQRARGASVHGAALRVVRGVPELFGPGGGASGNGPSIGFPAHL